ncbi:unannotated protein [freshwater metagenome]|uniref:Unannotated protein n=1 Tax=freshwater metagenome TaxID=449393 RepID=A0A6J6R628_9ZZZZ|nr:hypothetical protein [Actinomycetota bacterium]
MPDKLKSIEAELVKVLEEYGPNVEEIFNLGVKIGRELQAKNLPDYRLETFVKKEEIENLRESIRNKKREIADLILNQVHAAIKEIIDEGDSWDVGVGSYYRNDGKFSDEIVKKYFVQFESIQQPQTNGSFETYFRVKGKLEETFNKFEYGTTIEITLDNDSGEDNTSISSERDIQNLYSPSLMIGVEQTLEGLEKLKQFKEAIVKNLMFQIIGRT